MDQSTGLIGYIYRTFSPASGQFYIGRRYGAFDPDYFGSGVRITRWIRKYGKGSLTVQVLEWAESHARLDELERYYIKVHREFGFDLMNIADGGQGSAKGTVRPQWVVEKCRLANIGVSRTVSAEARKKAADKNRGRKHSPEARLKMSLARKLVPPPSLETRAKMRAARLGRKFGPIPPETRMRMSMAQKGRKKSPEQIAKTVAGLKKRWSETPKQPPTPEHRRKISEALKKYFAERKKPNAERQTI